ncbi:hypothetical protein QRE66_28280 (plasmid) [Bacillus cereus]|nr:hypothetical protein QRE66_28280 [Bacillus cereus]
MLVYEEDKKHYRNIVGETEWVLLDDIHNHQGMDEGRGVSIFVSKGERIRRGGSRIRSVKENRPLK